MWSMLLIWSSTKSAAPSFMATRREKDMAQTVASADATYKPTSSTAAGCLLMASLFAYSASVQLNDVDWYLWFPLYTLASLVSLFHVTGSTPASRAAALVGLTCGALLFVKVVAEGCIVGGQLSLSELFSLDMDTKEVREKLGSMLVVLALWLQTLVFGGVSKVKSRSMKLQQLGIWVFVAASSGLCVAYFFRKTI